MDAVQTIRADGKITIANRRGYQSLRFNPGWGWTVHFGGGRRPNFKVKQITVTVQSSAFIIYVTGAVLRPGKIITDRPLTVFQAVMEAGIDPVKSNLTKVKVISYGRQWQKHL